MLWSRACAALALASLLLPPGAASSRPSSPCASPLAPRALPELARPDSSELRAEGRSALLERVGAHLAARDLERAAEALERALALEARADEGPGLRAALLDASGSFHAALGAEARAREDYLGALELASGDAEPRLSARILINLSALELAAGDAGSALRAAERALGLADEAAAPHLAASAGTAAARAALAAAQPALAGRRLRAALPAAQQLEADRPKAELLIRIGLALVATQEALDRETGTSDGVRPVEAGPLAALAFREAAQLAVELEAPHEASWAWGELAALYERAGRLDEALELTRRALFSAARAEADLASFRWHWQLGRIRRAQAETDRAIGAFSTAVEIYLERIQGRGELVAPGAFESEIRPVFTGLVDLLLERAATREDERERRVDLRRAVESLEALKVDELRDYFQSDCAPPQRDPAAIPGTLVLYPIALPDRMELILLRHTAAGSDLAALRIEASVGEIETQIRLFRQLLEKRATRQYLRPSMKLYDWLIRPVEKWLAGRPIETLVLVPGGSLRTIPIAALYDRDAGQFLIEKLPVAITPGLSLTDPRPLSPQALEVLVAGLTTSVEGFAPLPSVRTEIDAVTALFDHTSLVDEAFVASAIERELLERQFGIFHIASHGVFGADPRDTFVVTSEGRLSMSRLSGLVGITAYREQPLELLTLSACETARGDGAVQERAALGLAGVAVQAGARSALATLWSIDDRAASELVQSFYRALAEPGASRARALQHAQVSLIRDPRYQHPGYWAPFLLISSWL